MSTPAQCQDCNGEGRIPREGMFRGEICEACNGTGMMSAKLKAVKGLEHRSYYWIKLDGNSFWQPARWVKPFDVGHWELIGEDYWRDAGDVHEVGAEITYDAR